jgi:hypothetical protein
MSGDADELIKIPARRGFSLRYKNKTLLSAIDPVSQAEKAASGVEQRERTLYFCPSPLLGYGLEGFLSRLASGSALLCVESGSALLSLSRSSIKQSVLNHPRFLLTGECDEAALFALVRERWGSRAFRRVTPLKLNGGWQLDAARYQTLENALRKDIALEWGNAMTLVRLGRRYTRNALRNLAALGRARPLAGLSFGSWPVLVLGAGPSLDAVLDGLGAAGLFSDGAGRTFALVCVDTCISVLLERGIRPDLAVILESQFWNMNDFSGARDSRIPAAVDLSAYPAAAGVLGGPVYFFFTPWTSLRLFERMNAAGILPPKVPPLGSVGLTAVELARRLTCGPVITAGIDFSFTLDRTHARGSPGHQAALRNGGRFQSLVNAAAAFRQGVFSAVSKTGVPVRSNPAMRTYRDLFEETFAGDRRLYDIAVPDSAGAAGLPLGLKTLTLRDTAILLTGAPALSAPEPRPAPAGQTEHAPAAAGAFIQKEHAALRELRDILSGGQKAGAERLSALLDDLDYLWAHFPDCAGADGRRPPVSDTAFLKRVRAEIDPFAALWERAGTLIRLSS